MKRQSRGHFVLGVVFLLAVVFTLWNFSSVLIAFLGSGKSFPVQAVRVDGVLSHVTKRQIADTVGKIAGDQNIAAIEPEQIRESLLKNPWLARVAVHRKMPDTIVVSVVEHVPAAFWNSDGLYDATAKEIFKPDLTNFGDSLVRLGAYRDNLAPEVYDSAVALIRLLQGTRYQMVALYLDQVRCYTLTLSDGTKLILGKGINKCVERLQRLLHALPQVDFKLEDVSYVDLRYDVGFAVGPAKKAPQGESSEDGTVSKKQ